MATNKLPNNTILFIALPLVGIAIGWFLRGSPANDDKGASQNPAQKTPSAQLNEQQSRYNGKRASGPNALTADSDALEKLEQAGRIYTGPRDVKLLTEVMRFNEYDDVGMIELLGRMSQMTDAEIEAAWDELSRQQPRMGIGSKYVALYIASRMAQMGIKVEFPRSWHYLEKEFETAFLADEARRNPEKILEKILNNEAVPPVQRQIYFSEAFKENPTETLDLWLNASTEEQLVSEAMAMGNAMLDPVYRQSLMNGLDQKISDTDTKLLVINDLTEEWIQKDPAAVEAWVHSISDTGIRNSMLYKVMTTKGASDPFSGLEWSKNLSGELRDEAFAYNGSEMANHDWERGMEFIAGIEHPNDREAALKGFGYMMAVDRYDEFAQWRETLPPQEQDIVNKEAFLFYAHNDVAHAVAWLNDRPYGEERDQLTVTLMRVYAHEYPEAAIPLIQAIQDPEARKQAITVALQGIGPHELDKIRLILNAEYDGLSDAEYQAALKVKEKELPANRELLYSPDEHTD